MLKIKHQLTNSDNFNKTKKNRTQKYIFENIDEALLNKYKQNGWEFYKQLKNSIKVRKLKKSETLFENDIWVLFSKLGFNQLNMSNDFQIQYTDKLAKQIDIFAADEDTIIIIECKCSKKNNKKCDFKQELESIYGYMEGVRNAIRKEFQNHKVKFLFATREYNVGHMDLERMKEFEIVHFNEQKYSYYLSLANHLGNAAKYQLLGNLFEGKKIPSLDTIVPAILGKMGNHYYYSFSVEPDILLKLGYVLHRNDSNKDSMPTYQRIIKKSRLQKISEFVDNGGYFPNSIIVNIDSGKKIKFDIAGKNTSNSLSKIGLLHLPQKYKSIFIIDGQHRLYAYSDSKYSTTNTIPVVAFENLSKDEQVKLFMEINENQKSVPKNLRNTLDEDLKYSSPNPKERRDALTLRIARELGEDRNSPLFERIIIGENEPTPTRNITLEAISKAIRDGKYLSKFKSNGVLNENGLIDKDDNDETFKVLYPIIVQSFKHIKNEIGEAIWILPKTVEYAFVNNNVISGLIRTINSILVHENRTHNLQGLPLQRINDMIIPYLNIIINFWNTISQDVKLDLTTSYGGGGPIKCCRNFEKAINTHFPSFKPFGLEKYWLDRNQDNVNNANTLISELRLALLDLFKRNLDLTHGEDNFDTCIPKSVLTTLTEKMINYNYGKRGAETRDLWHFMEFNDLKKIAIEGNWSTIFKEILSYPTKGKGNKEEKTKWLSNVSNIQNKLKTDNSISVEDYQDLQDISSFIFMRRK